MGLTRGPASRTELLRLVRAYAEECFAQPTSPRVSELAHRLHITSARLVQAFGSEHGTPGQYLKRLQIQRAKHLLRSTDSTAEEVARLAGFGLRKTLARRFRAATGTTPTQYRGAK